MALLPNRPLLASERGAILVQVAVAILVLTGMSAFVLDQGAMWLARRQAQNAADAGALSGAIARAFDEKVDPPAAGGLAETSASSTATANSVGTIGGTKGVSVAWTCPTFAAGNRCVRVDVFRDGTNGSTALPTFFANVFAITSQPVRASAVAWVRNGNTTNCMRPFAVPDRWTENGPSMPDNPGDEFNRWKKVGNSAVEVSPKDVYIPPNSSSASTGYTPTTDVGVQVTMRLGNGAGNAITPGWFLAVRLPEAVDANGNVTSWLNGAQNYTTAIRSCIGKPVSIGQYLPLENGAMVGPTKQGTVTDPDSLVNSDPQATWVGGVNGHVSGGCVPACGAFSPRIVPITVYDQDEYQWRDRENNWTTSWIPGVGPGTGTFSCPAGGHCIRVANIIGFFVEGMVGGDVRGRVVMLPGEFLTGSSSLANSASFMQTIQLIR